MSQLIQMRRRIKTIETIHKITNAMRLIAMSGHSKLKRGEELIKNYNKQVEELYVQIQAKIPGSYDPLAIHIDPKAPELIILVGSQKGLCGNFNSNLFKLTEGYIESGTNPRIIAIGKRVSDFVKDKNIGTLIDSKDKFAISNIKDIVKHTLDHIHRPDTRFARIIVISNILKNFFAQRPVISQLLPLSTQQIEISDQLSHQNSSTFEEYLWEQTPQSIIHDLSYLYLEAKLHSILFQSLLSEQAARFLSMDSSTRNAEGLLELSKIQYNQLRQAKITKEINELVSNIGLY